MTDDQTALATKADLENAIEGLRVSTNSGLNNAIDGLRAELVQHVDEMLDNKLSTLKQEIISAFRMTEEDIRKETAHADEVSALDDRLKHVEAYIGINER